MKRCSRLLSCVAEPVRTKVRREIWSVGPTVTLSVAPVVDETLVIAGRTAG